MKRTRGIVAGVVLAGGLSSRLGQEKASLRVHGGEQPVLLRRTYDLASLLPVCWVACRPGQPRAGYPCVFDRVEGLGPFSGVQTALLEARMRGIAAVLTLSCDLPFMDEATLRALLTGRESAPPTNLMTTYCQKKTGFIEGLTAIYETAGLPWFDAACARRERKLSRIIPEHLQTRIIYSEQEALPFFNINYPADLALARRLLTSQ